MREAGSGKTDGAPGRRDRIGLAALCLALCAAAMLGGCSVFSGPGVPQGYKGGKGTQRPYTINGVTYYPLASAHGYAEEGVASWYGPNFHGKRTSNGEIYDMYAMTAAHKILPMNTVLKVTNMENGRSIEVRVNDRGPFVAGRIIDLSRAGAEALDMHKKGTARVRVETLGDIPGVDMADLSSMRGVFYVQVGAFVNPENAERLLTRMQRMGYAGSRLHFREVDGERYWRVHAGTFGSLGEAERARRDLDGQFKGAFVIAE